MIGKSFGSYFVLILMTACATLAIVVADFGALAQDTMTDTSAGEAMDLTGSYTGTVHAPELGLEGDATLEISGNQFTLTSGGQTKKGRLSAVTTRGYTGVAMMFTDDAAAPAAGTPPPTPMSVSVKLVKTRNGFVLTNVPGAKRILHGRFYSAGGDAMTAPSRGTRRSRGRRGRRSRTTDNMNSNTDDNMNPGVIR